MSDRVNYLTVVLEDPMRDDDAAAIVHAVEMIKGVIGVEMNVPNSRDYAARDQVRYEFRQKLRELLE